MHLQIMMSLLLAISFLSSCILPQKFWNQIQQSTMLARLLPYIIARAILRRWMCMVTSFVAIRQIFGQPINMRNKKSQKAILRHKACFPLGMRLTWENYFCDAFIKSHIFLMPFWYVFNLITFVGKMMKNVISKLMF